jgi:pyruvate-ferredoxin/flavodoxin oxidoreductase
MAARTTGFALLSSSTVQEAQDLALVAHAATLQTRIPFIHFFDGFRTSHEINRIEPIEKEQMRSMIDDGLVRAHQRRALNPDQPVMRGTAQNPDTYFQARESVNSFYEALPDAVQQKMDELAALTGRQYGLVDYFGGPQADLVIVIMGSGASTVREAVEWLNVQGPVAGRGRYAGLVVRLFRPFPAAELLQALPSSVRRIAVLDRTKEPGANGEPLYQDVVTALAQDRSYLPLVIGGRYNCPQGFTAMVRGVFDELASDSPAALHGRHIRDITHRALISTKLHHRTGRKCAPFYGLRDGRHGGRQQEHHQDHLRASRSRSG